MILVSGGRQAAPRHPWSRAAADLWGLRADEVQGEHVLNLDIGIPVDRLRDSLRAVLAGDEPPGVELEGHNR